MPSSGRITAEDNYDENSAKTITFFQHKDHDKFQLHQFFKVPYVSFMASIDKEDKIKQLKIIPYICMLLLHNLQAEIPMRMNSSRSDQGRTTAAAEGAVEALAVAPPYRTWGNEETFTKETIKDIFQDILKNQQL